MPRGWGCLLWVESGCLGQATRLPLQRVARRQSKATFRSWQRALTDLPAPPSRQLLRHVSQRPIPCGGAGPPPPHIGHPVQTLQTPNAITPVPRRTNQDHSLAATGSFGATFTPLGGAAALRSGSPTTHGRVPRSHRSLTTTAPSGRSQTATAP